MKPSADATFDPYLQWLGIPPDQQPADHYRLLGLPRFESDPQRVEAAADERMNLVRKHQAGPRGTLTQPLLNELAAARNCLMDLDSKAAYDEQLRNRPPAAPMAKVVLLPTAAILEPPMAIAPPRAEPTTNGAHPPVEQGGNHDADHEADSPSLASLALSFLGMATAVVLVAAAVLGIGRLFWSASESDERLPKSTKRVPDEASSSELNPGNEPTAEQSSPPSGSAARIVVVMQEGSRDVNLTPATAVANGSVKLKPTGGEDVLDQWSLAGDSATWTFKLLRPGFFQVELSYTALPEAAGTKMQALLDAKEVNTFSLSTAGDLSKPTTARHTIAVTSSGQHTLAIRLLDDVSPDSLVVKQVRLTPVADDSDEKVRPSPDRP